MRDAIHSTSTSVHIDTYIFRLEEAALNATVVREQMLYDGWLVRWAPSQGAARPLSRICPSVDGTFVRREP